MTSLVRLLHALVTALAVATPAPALAAEPPPVPGAVERAVPFGARPDGRTLRMDVHRPAVRMRTGGAPAMVWIHGGGFHSGDRARMTPYARAFARRGWVAATIDYRLRPHAEIRARGYAAGEPDAQADAERAIRYLRRHADRYGIDPERIAVGGISAGAVTALNVALRPSGPERVRGVVAISGYGPTTGLDADDPPLLLMHGTADLAVPFARAQRTCAAATAGGASCELVPFPGAGHRVGLLRAERIADRAGDWLERTALRRLSDR